MSDAIIASNGMMKDPNTGKFIGGKPTNAITRENSAAYHRARKEKTQAAIRQGLKQATKLPSSIQAVALGAEVLYKKVLDEEYDLDKRRKTWLSIGKQAGLLEDQRTHDINTGDNIIIPVQTMDRVLDLLRDKYNSHGNE